LWFCPGRAMPIPLTGCQRKQTLSQGCGGTHLPLVINRSWCLIAERLVWPFMVIKIQIVVNASAGISWIYVVFEIDFLVLD
jgi:hypothetical protein